MKSLLQTKQWAALRQAQGWQIHWVEEILILEKKLPLGKSFLYSPENEWENIDTKYEIIYENTKKLAENSKAIFLRLEILDKYDEKIVQKLKENGFIKSFEEVQPEWRQIIDITKTEDEILAQMKEKGRYNIRVAKKHNIVIENPPAGGEKIDEFYTIFCQTAKRDGFQIRPKQYFEKLFENLKNDNLVELLVAKYNGKTIAAEIVTYYDGVASYLYGASANEYRNLMAPYLLHWQAILNGKKRNCKTYDLLAIEPFRQPQSAIGFDGNNINFKAAESGKRTVAQHKYTGITRFKEQFGGRKVHLVGSWDYVYRPTWYKLFKMAEQLRRK